MGAASRPRLLVPGLVPRDPARETYRVRPGGTTAVTLRPGRPAHDPRPPRRAARRGGRAERPGRGCRPLRARVAAGRRGDVPRRPRPRSSRSAHRPERPVVEGGVPASDLQLEITRAHPDDGAVEPRLPDPLADPRLDFQVDRASRRSPTRSRPASTSRSSTCKGRQCSDFLAFSAPKLQEGKERGLDATATRSLMGQCLPLPRPLLQVLRPRPRAARRGRPRHRRPPRHLRPRLHGQVLRGHGLLRPRQLLRQLQRPAAAVHDRAAQGLAGDQLLLQHRLRRPQPVRHRRAVVAARATTCCCAR